MESLRELAPTIRQICSISGVTGVSIGVIQHGKVIYQEGFGFCDVEAKFKPDSDTIYCLGSMSRIIEALTGGSFSHFLKTRLFEPLGMSRSFGDDVNCHGVDNISKSYAVLDDGPPHEIPRPKIMDGTIMNTAGGIQSNVRDLLKYYGALLSSANHHFATRSTQTPDSPLKQLPTTVSGHTSTAESIREQTYGLGWTRIGDPEHPRLVIFYHGMLLGAANTVYLLPKTEAAVVLLSNTIALNDGPDWIAHLILQTLFGDPKKLVILDLAEQTANEALSIYDKLGELAAQRISEPPPKPMKAHTGTYRNSVKTFGLMVFEKDCKLWMNFKGNKLETCLLTYWKGDTFSWLMTRNEQVKRARDMPTNLDMWKIVFVDDGNGNIDHIIWAMEPEIKEGVIFYKDSVGFHSEL
ncbi:beta-lactamase/transpeptidase-like protein [Bisporella sp. PMI_857]|nr:beta-lactamase/transpeptidase-like protein [Bisporella sp. PMI_857]